MPGRAESPWLGRRIGGVALDGHAVGVLDGAEPGGDAGLAGGDGLAVAPAVRALREALAELLDLTDMGLAFVGVGGDGQDGGVGGGGVQDEADRLAAGLAVGQGDDLGPVGLGPGPRRLGEALLMVRLMVVSASSYSQGRPSSPGQLAAVNASWGRSGMSLPVSFLR